MTSHASLALGSIALLLAAPQPGSTTQGLRAAAERALEANHHLTVRVLWLDRVPADSGGVTAGPALAQLVQSAAARLRAGIRVRVLADHLQVSGLWIRGPLATARLTDRERVLPCSLAGRPLGAAVNLHEAALAILHKLPGTERFVVWELKPR
jgi:hypothetical protein